MALKDVRPYTATGETGLCFIMDETSIPAFIEREAQRLVDAGYVRLIITDHVASQVVGDRRRRR